MPVITIGRQFGAGGTTVGEMLARRLKIDLLESRIIDEVAHRLQLPKEEVEAEDEQPGLTQRRRPLEHRDERVEIRIAVRRRRP